MRVYFSFYEEDGNYELEAIALSPETIIEAFGEIPVYYYDWESEVDFFSPMIDPGDYPYEIYNVWSGVIKKEEDLDAYFSSWSEFRKVCDAYEQETGKDIDWYVSWTDTYVDGVLVQSTRPDIETLVAKLKSYLQ